MSLIDKIIKQKLEKYLSKIIKSYAQNQSKSVLQDFNQELLNPSEENILKYFYFYKFHLKNKEESQESLKIIEEMLRHLGLNNIEANKFYKNYGSICPNLLETFYNDYYNKNLTENEFINLTNILMFNEYKDWEIRCLDKFSIFKNNPFEFRISKMINKKLGENRINVNLNYNDMHYKADITYSQISITNLFIKKFGLKVETEKRFDDYVVDIYLPELDLIFEFDGPDHFYPLQSQFNNRNKFRYRYFYNILNKRIVSFPYFESCRLDNDYFTYQLMYKLIYSEYDIFDSELFKTNFDLLKPIWKFKKVKVISL